MSQADTAWREGEEVQVRGQSWTIGAVTPFTDCVQLDLRAAGNGSTGDALAVLCPFDRPRALRAPSRLVRVHRRRWLHEVRRLACGTRPFGSLHDAGERFSILPYQLEPALAFLRHGATRVLIADGVGLGKTIQAGVLLSTLSARNPLLRALVVTPAGLREQWHDELRDRFQIEATIASSAWLRDTGRDLPVHVSPWALPGAFITSYDFIKRAEVLRPLEDLAWDLLIADEAHNAAPGTDRRLALDAVARRSIRVLLLTATPDSGEAGDYESLCDIGRCSPRDHIVVFQRTRAAVGQGRPRRTNLIAVRPTAAERHMHRVLDRYIAEVRRSRGLTGGARLAMVVLKKRALSSARSLADSARRRRELIAGDVAPRQILLPLGDEDPLDDESADDLLGAPALADARAEARLLERVVTAAVAARAESKQAFLVRLLRRIREPAIIFTEYRDTLRHVEHLLARAGHAVTVIHGGLSPEDRSMAQQQFTRAGGVLLATDAAAEGLNLHERCRLVIHFELPWTPMRLEQRAGRVDRIGQTRRVHEILLVSGHAAERMVLVPLARRASHLQRGGHQSGLGSVLTESAVAAAILEGTPLPNAAGRHPITRTMEIVTDATSEAARLEQLRRWKRQSRLKPNTRRRRGVFVCRPRRGQLTTQIFRLVLRDADGRVAHDELVAARGDGPDERVLERSLLLLLSERILEIDARCGVVRSAASCRAEALAADVSSAALLLVQGSLFDRRALRAAAERRLASASLKEQLASHGHTTVSHGPLTASLACVALMRHH